MHICVDIVITFIDHAGMKQENHQADTHIHLRARADDKALIDRVAELQGINRSQFLMSAALKEAKSYLLEQTSFHADTKSFDAILDWMETPATDEEKSGMSRLMAEKGFSGSE